jgi:hypothetical protein
MAPTKIFFSSDSLEGAEFEVQVLDGGRITGTGANRTFHERDSTFGNDVSSVQWRVNTSGDAVRVGLIKGNAFICEIKVLTDSGETHHN